MPDYTLIRGDALTRMTELPTGSVDCVICDPPYNSGGRTTQERVGRTAREKYTTYGSKKVLPDFPGENKDQRSYGFWLTQLLTEAYRLTADGGTVCVFSDWRQLPTTTDALQAGGWTWRGIVPWHKPAARPQAGRFTQNAEFVAWGSRGAMDKERHPVYLKGLLEGSQPSGSKRQHITQKPLGVMRALVQICPPGGTVLDFTAGSGSTGVAALAEGRSFLGIELTEHYADIAEQRLAEAKLAADQGLDILA